MSVQPHKCQECDTIITTRRKTCSDACKQKAYRQKHGKKIDTIVRTVTVQQKKIAVQEKQIADLNWLIHDLRKWISCGIGMRNCSYSRLSQEARYFFHAEPGKQVKAKRGTKDNGQRWRATQIQATDKVVSYSSSL